MGKNKKKKMKWTEDLAEKLIEDENIKNIIKDSFQKHGISVDEGMTESIKKGMQEGMEEVMGEEDEEGIKKKIKEAFGIDLNAEEKKK